MRRVFAASLVLLLAAAGCDDENVTLNDTREAGLYLQVVDAQGNPVEGVRVHLVSLPDEGQGEALVAMPEEACHGEVR